MIYLITGGSGSGKSEYAEDLLCNLCKDQTDQLVYIATMFPYGDETKEKIRRHRQMRRDKGFRTIECYTDVGSAAGELKRYGRVSVLIECISNLVSNELDIQRDDRAADQTGRRELVISKVIEGVEAVRQAAVNVVVVTNEVNSEGLEYTAEMTEYKQVMGEVNCRLAEMADEVAEIVYGMKVEVKSSL